MKGVNLGELEELILLTVGILYPEAYGVGVMDEIEKQASRQLNISAVHSVLTRLEEKGFLTSEFGETTLKRGGKRKRIYTTTSYAHKVLAEMKEIRAGLWEAIPKLTPQLKVI